MWGKSEYVCRVVGQKAGWKRSDITKEQGSLTMEFAIDLLLWSHSKLSGQEESW